MTKHTITRDMAAQIAIEPDPRLTPAENEFRKKVLRVRKRIEAAGWGRPLTAKEQRIGSQIDDALRSVEAFRAYMAAQAPELSGIPGGQR